MFQLYRNQSIEFQWKSIDWFLYHCNVGLIQLNYGDADVKRTKQDFAIYRYATNAIFLLIVEISVKFPFISVTFYLKNCTMMDFDFNLIFAPLMLTIYEEFLNFPRSVVIYQKKCVIFKKSEPVRQTHLYELCYCLYCFLALGKTQLANYDNIFILVLSVHHFWGESSKVLFRCLFFVTYIRFLLLILGFCHVYQVFVTYIRFLLRISGFCYVYQVFVTYIRTDHML